MKKQLLASASLAVLMAGAAGMAQAQTGPQVDVTGSTSDNSVQDMGGDANNTVTQSGDGTDGVVHMQENNGSANLINLATNVTTLTEPSEGEQVRLNALVGFGERLSTSDNAIGSKAGTRSNTLDGSFGNSASGIAGVQQNNGHANAIGAGNAVLGLTNVPDERGPNIDQDAQTLVSTKANHGIDDDGVEPSNDTQLTIDSEQDRDNTVEGDSFDGFDGLASVQQNNGDANAIGATTSVVGIADTGDGNEGTGGDDDDLGSLDQDVEADGQVVNTPGEGIADGGDAGIGSTRDNEISNSFEDLSGVATVQQNNGTHNAMASATAVLGVSPATVGGDADDAENPGTITQNVRADGGLGSNPDEFGTTGVQATDNGSSRTNDIDANAFDSADGVLSVQQNNGDTNSVNAATGVVALINDVNEDENEGSGGLDQTADAAGNNATVNSGADLDVEDNGSSRTNTIDNAFASVSGTGSVQQNNGNANSMNTATAVAAISTEETDDSIDGGVDQSAVDAGENSIRSLDTDDNGSSRTNKLTSGSFNGIAGQLAVQQNNGDANTMNVATAVAATRSSVTDGVTQDARADDSEVNDRDVGNETVDVDSQGEYSRLNDIDESFDNADGVLSVQQNNGDANTVNAGTAVFGAVDGGGPNPPKGGTINGGLTQERVIARNNVIDSVEADDGPGDRENEIVDSFDFARGVSNVQQNSGNANSLDVAAAIAGSNGDVNGGLTQDPVGGNNALDNNIGTDVGVDVKASSSSTRTNQVYRSFFQANGIHNVQQNNGDANSMNVATSVAAVTGAVNGGVTQDVGLTGTTIGDVEPLNGDYTDAGSERTNTVDSSFRDSSGVITLQQNNGSANSMNAATAVAYAGSTSGTIDQDVDGSATVSDEATTGIGGQGVNRDNNLQNQALDNSSGVATVQQNNGDGNYMGSGTAVTAALGDPVSDTTLSGSVDGSTVKAADVEDGTNVGSNTVSNSLNTTSGVVTVQQNNGNNNVIQSAITVSADVTSQ